MLRATFLILAKDLRALVRNRTIFILGFVAPFVLAFVLNIVFGGLDDPDAPVTFDVGVVQQDEGEIAAAFAEVVDAMVSSGLIDLRRYDDEAAARDAVDDGDVAAAWIVPAGLSEAVLSGRRAELLVIGDVDAPNTAAFARAVAERFALGVGVTSLAHAVAGQTGATGTVGDVAAAEPIAALRPLEAESVLLDTTTMVTAGMAVFFVFFTAGLPLVSLLDERQRGTLARLLAAPIPAGAITTGKALAAVVLGVVSLAGLMVASSLLMDAEWGPFGGALLLALAAVIAATGIMALAGSLARTPDGAGSIQAVVAVALALLGGAFVPIPGSEAGLLAVLQKLTPHGWFFEGLERLQAEGVAAALPSVLVLLGMGVVTGALGTRSARAVLRR